MAGTYAKYSAAGGGGGGIASINGNSTSAQTIVGGTDITVVSAGGTTTVSFGGTLAYANQALSNLTSPTAINQTLQFSSGDIGTSSGGTPGNVYISSGGTLAWANTNNAINTVEGGAALAINTSGGVLWLWENTSTVVASDMWWEYAAHDVGSHAGVLRPANSMHSVYFAAGESTITTRTEGLQSYNNIWTNGYSSMGSQQIGNSATASVAVGTLVGKYPIYDQTGTLIGYVPIYSTIT